MSDTPRTCAVLVRCRTKDTQLEALCDLSKDLERELDAAIARYEERRAMLEKHQWAVDEDICPECRYERRLGHAAYCELARLIQKEAK